MCDWELNPKQPLVWSVGFRFYVERMTFTCSFWVFLSSRERPLADTLVFHFNGFHFSQQIRGKITNDDVQNGKFLLNVDWQQNLFLLSLSVIYVPTNGQLQLSKNDKCYLKRSWYRIYVQIFNAEVCVTVLPVSFCETKVGQTVILIWCSIQVIQYHTEVLDHTSAVLYVITTWYRYKWKTKTIKVMWLRLY